MCHVRAATVGNITDMNAHPFEAYKESGAKITGIHNGTLRNWRGHETAKDFTVDSDWAFQMIAEHGEDAFQYFDGAYAMIWYDEEAPGHVFMARNDERPLHFMYGEDGKTIYGASEAGMLGWIAERNGIKMSKDEAKAGIFYLTPGLLYKFSLEEVGVYDSWELPKLDMRLLPKPEPVKYPHTNLTPSYNHKTGMYDAYEGAYTWDDDEDDYASWWGNVRGNSTLAWGQDRVIGELKKVLSKARSERYKAAAIAEAKEEEDSIITAEDIQEAMHDAIVASYDPAPELNGTASLVTADSSTATKGEIARAEEENVFGMIVGFEGLVVNYDDPSAIPETVGEFYLQVGKSRKSYSASVRGIPDQKAEALFIKNTNPVPCAIIGLVENPITRGLEYILVPLTNRQRQLVLASKEEEAVAS